MTSITKSLQPQATVAFFILHSLYYSLTPHPLQCAPASSRLQGEEGTPQDTGTYLLAEQRRSGQQRSGPHADLRREPWVGTLELPVLQAGRRWKQFSAAQHSQLLFSDLPSSIIPITGFLLQLLCTIPSQVLHITPQTVRHTSNTRHMLLLQKSHNNSDECRLPRSQNHRITE